MLPAGLESELTECSKGSPGTKSYEVCPGPVPQAKPSEGGTPLPDGAFPAGLSVCLAAKSKAE